jgi:hypothetical protein
MGKAMGDGEAGIVTGVMDDRQRHVYARVRLRQDSLSVGLAD